MDTAYMLLIDPQKWHKRIIVFFGDPVLSKRPSEKATFYSNTPKTYLGP